MYKQNLILNKKQLKLFNKKIWLKNNREKFKEICWIEYDKDFILYKSFIKSIILLWNRRTYFEFKKQKDIYLKNKKKCDI